MNVLFIDGKISENKGKTAVENAAEIRKEFEDFKGHITDKFVKSKLESRSGIADCKGAIAVIHGIFEEQDKKIKALEKRIYNLADHVERELSELMHRPDNSEKAIYTKYIDNGGRMYYKCGKCYGFMNFMTDSKLFCPRCGIAVKK